ncbi:polysaccharide biosynthesis protein, partial [Patescibacteria group bacterium]|nr:polysaccharide biosynthesis protein [Patescibacteria group bacterium]
AFEGVDIVVHAAALKQVPATEFNPFEAIRTNIIGSQNVIEAALNNNIKKTLLISSDKAVQPINLYGATKLCAERLFVAANVYAGEKRNTKFSVVRYGNVIGSRGSLVEIIKNQKEKGVIDLTDKEMTRFWIPIKKVIEVILNEVLNQMEGGEIFVPKMKSLKVVDVIKHLVPKCRINIIGIRPGEKLHETLITEYEAKRTVDLKNIFAIKPEFDLFKNEWLKNKLSVKGGFIYSSDNSKFILPLKKASELLGDEI